MGKYIQFPSIRKIQCWFLCTGNELTWWRYFSILFIIHWANKILNSIITVGMGQPVYMVIVHEYVQNAGQFQLKVFHTTICRKSKRVSLLISHLSTHILKYRAQITNREKTRSHVFVNNRHHGGRYM